MPKKKKTKVIFGAGTAKIAHHAASKHVVEKKGRGKRANKKVSVKC